jgi:23S rRNA U2552 (ribose-2'-O)-methylase RlmE/FtsJ
MGINYKPGSSLRVWKDYFKNAEIYGADLDKTILFNNEDKIHTFYVDQLDSGSIKKMWDNIGKTNFDIIIDDGLHTYDANLNFFLNSFDKLKKNGIYIIEDVQYHYLITIHDKLRQYNPNIILIDSKDFTRACFEGGTPQGFGENLIVFKKV